ncbi:universal stress protein [Phycicoccus sp. 3266]|uniref:universal stress protein n=1 Tax=Phycicoccus sp. 3266 TaxID=2817751 RepID=UPI00285446D6|nr:universal stress protein [Phycicoccus sp. 3266]MDR6864816.1 nucleotide-binding universal stress UspA family protein [Phycicoccus sp. 3266]
MTTHVTPQFAPVVVLAPVVVGVDADDPVQAVLDTAVDLASELAHPLHVVNATGVGIVPWTPEMVGRQEARTEAVRASLEARSRVPVTGETMYTSPAKALVDASHDAALVVVGAGRLGTVSAAVLGATTSQVAAHAECPVLVVPHEGLLRHDGPVVVGVDIDPHSEPALEYAFAEAARRSVPLVAVHSWWWESPDAFMSGHEWEDDFGAVADTQHRQLAEMLAGWQDKYPDVQVRTEVVRGQAVSTLCDEAQGAQLLVVGSRGRGGFRGLLLGSVSTRLLHQSPCPVAVVPSFPRPARDLRGRS